MAVATRTVPVTARRLIDNRVRDTEGNSIGEVEDFVIDPTRGCIDYAVVSFGGFMGLGKEYHIIPYQMLKIHPDGRSFMSNIQKDQLEHAPGFDRGNVPEMDDRYLSSVYSYWGVQRGETQQQMTTGQQGYRQGGETTYQSQPSGYTERPQGSYTERSEGTYAQQRPQGSYTERSQGTYGQRESEGEREEDQGPWTDRYRGLFWHGRDEDRNR